MASEPESKSRAELLGTRLSRAATDFLKGLRTPPGPPDPFEAERQLQLARYSAELSAYHKRASKLKSRLTIGWAAVIGGAALAASSIDALAAEAPVAVIGTGIAALGAWQARRRRSELQGLTEPKPPPPLAGLPEPLEPGSASADTVQRIRALRTHLVQLLPALEQVHPRAAEEVRRADASSAPLLNALVERIRFLQQITHQMPDTPMSKAAGISIDALQIRLDEGAAAYQELLAATISITAQPSIGGHSVAALTPAIHELQAYAAGLAAVERTQP